MIYFILSLMLKTFLNNIINTNKDIVLNTFGLVILKKLLVVLRKSSAFEDWMPGKQL